MEYVNAVIGRYFSVFNNFRLTNLNLHVIKCRMGDKYPFFKFKEGGVIDMKFKLINITLWQL